MLLLWMGAPGFLLVILFWAISFNRYVSRPNVVIWIFEVDNGKLDQRENLESPDLYRLWAQSDYGR